MSNPLFQMMGNAMLPGMGNMQNLIQQFQQFRQTFSGDPRQQVQQMLNSGQVTQEQYNRAVQMANQLQRLMNGR